MCFCLGDNTGTFYEPLALFEGIDFIQRLFALRPNASHETMYNAKRVLVIGFCELSALVRHSLSLPNR